VVKNFLEQNLGFIKGLIYSVIDLSEFQFELYSSEVEEFSVALIFDYAYRKSPRGSIPVALT